MVKNVAIVSLSAGTIGEDFVKHEVDLGLRRLHDYGLEVKMMPHAMKGIEYVRNHPEDRAQDLIDAIRDDSIDLILCAIGGDDTYRMLPYLFENNELQKAVDSSSKEKIFLGFSDTTSNHLMLHNVSMKSFYGQAFLPDVCELDTEMLPYSAHYFEELIQTGMISEIRPSDCWYEERTDWTVPVGTPRTAHPSQEYQLVQGSPVFSGKILGGCIDTLFDYFDESRYEDSVALCSKYRLFPSLQDWQGKIMLLESSEEQPTPEQYREMLLTLKKTGVFSVISGILCGKPMDEMYYNEYIQAIKEVVDDPNLPIVANINVGHATPRCIIPFGVDATVDVNKQVIYFETED